MMRVFVAVDLDDDTRGQVRDARHDIEDVLSQARVPPRITWVSPAVAHVTVRFIGEVPDEEVASIAGALADVHVEPFDVIWTTIGTFGGVRHPRVIWMGASSGLEPFSRLVADVNHRLDPLIGPEPGRAATPHVTLGRVRDAGRGADWAGAIAAVRLRGTVTRVDHVTLYRSHLSPRGPTYTALSRHG